MVAKLKVRESTEGHHQEWSLRAKVIKWLGVRKCDQTRLRYIPQALLHRDRTIDLFLDSYDNVESRLAASKE